MFPALPREEWSASSNKPQSHRRISEIIPQSILTIAADVDDADVGILGEVATEASDEDLEAAGVEEVVVAPEIQEDVLHGDYFSF